MKSVWLVIVLLFPLFSIILSVECFTCESPWSKNFWSHQSSAVGLVWHCFEWNQHSPKTVILKKYDSKTSVCHQLTSTHKKVHVPMCHRLSSHRNKNHDFYKMHIGVTDANNRHITDPVGSGGSSRCMLPVSQTVTKSLSSSSPPFFLFSSSSFSPIWIKTERRITNAFWAERKGDEFGVLNRQAKPIT